MEKQQKELEEAGVDMATIPVKELEEGDGEVIRAHQQWMRSLARKRSGGKLEAAQQQEDLLEAIYKWRDAKAKELQMAPAAVLADHIAKNIAYVRPTCVEALRAAGVRITGVETLAAIIIAAEPAGGFVLTQSQSSSSSSSSQDGPALMQFPAGPWTPPKKWDHAVYKIGKKLPQWEVLGTRFAHGEHAQALALSGGNNGQAVQLSTVVNHLLTSVLHGKPLDLGRLASSDQAAVPTEEEWERLDEAAAVRALDVVATEKLIAKELIQTIIGDSEAALADRALMAVWYNKVRWWAALKRAGFNPEFAPASAKKQKL